MDAIRRPELPAFLVKLVPTLVLRAQLAFVGIVVLILLAGWPLQAEASSPISYTAHDYRVLGKPTVSASLINRVLSTYSSPAAGKGQALYEDGVTYGIDPVFALAFFLHESTFGTAGVARVTLSLGNIRCTAGYPSCYKGYRAYSSWDAGFLDWYQLIHTIYVGRWGLTTVDQIIPVYAPASENNVPAYITAVKHAVDTWRTEQIITGRDVLNAEQSDSQAGKARRLSSHSSNKHVASCLQQTSSQSSRCSLSKRSQTRPRASYQWRPMRVPAPPTIQPNGLQQPLSITGHFPTHVK